MFLLYSPVASRGFVSSGVRASPPLASPPPRECPQCGEAALVWHPLPALTSDLIPLQPSDLKCHPVNLSFPTSSRLTIKPALCSKYYLLIYLFELYSFGLLFEGTWSCSWVIGPSRAFSSALWVSVLSIYPGLVAPTIEKRYTPWHNLWQACETRSYLIYCFFLSVPSSCSNLTSDGFQSFLCDR